MFKSANALYHREMLNHQERQKPRAKLKAAMGAVQKMVKMGKIASLMGGKGDFGGIAAAMHDGE